MLQHAPCHPRIDHDPSRRSHQKHLGKQHGSRPSPGARRGNAERSQPVAARRLEEVREEVSRLRFVDGLLCREIADRLGVSELEVSRVLKDAIVCAYAPGPDLGPRAA